MKQLIKELTTPTLTTAIIIDHFATKTPNLSSGDFSTGFSDHDMMFGIRKVSSLVKREPKIIKKHGN